MFTTQILGKQLPHTPETSTCPFPNWVSPKIHVIKPPFAKLPSSGQAKSGPKDGLEAAKWKRRMPMHIHPGKLTWNLISLN